MTYTVCIKNKQQGTTSWEAIIKFKNSGNKMKENSTNSVCEYIPELLELHLRHLKHVTDHNPANRNFPSPPHPKPPHDLAVVLLRSTFMEKLPQTTTDILLAWEEEFPTGCLVCTLLLVSRQDEMPEPTINHYWNITTEQHQGM